METKYLNDIDGFGWANGPGHDGFAKVCVCGESFWIKEVQEEPDGLLHGIVDNDLIAGELHGLKFGDRVSYRAA